MIFPIITASCCAIFAVFLMIFRYYNKPLKCLVFKSLASLSFLFTAIASYYLSGTQSLYGILIIIGAIFGLMGDIFLQLKAFLPNDFKKIVAMGMTLFAFGHFAYFGAILTSTDLSPYPFLIAVVFAIFAFFALSTNRFKGIGRIKPVGVAYYFVLSATMLQGFFSALYTDGFFATFFFIGSVSFFISDTLLSLMYFGGLKGRWTSITNLTTYYIAQLAIALSLLFM